MSTVWLAFQSFTDIFIHIMSIPDSLGFSHTRHIAKFSSKFYYRRLLEAIICLVVYKSVLIYCVHWLFSVGESPFFNILFEYVVSTFLVLNISIELYSHIDYKTSFVKYVLVNSGRMMLLFFDACSISNSYGMNRFNSHIGKTCLYFFPGQYCYSESQVSLWISNIVLSVLVYLKYVPLCKKIPLCPDLRFTEVQEFFRFNRWFIHKFRKSNLFYHAFLSVLLHYFLSNVIRKIYIDHLSHPAQDLSICFFMNIPLCIKLFVNILIVSYNLDMIFYFTSVIFSKPFDFFFGPSEENVCFKYPLLDAVRSKVLITKWLACQNAYRIARYDLEKKKLLFKLSHVQEEKPRVWNTILTEFSRQMKDFSYHVLDLHANNMEVGQPFHIVYCDNDIELFLKYTNEHEMLQLIILTMTELSCESIKYHPPRVVQTDIYMVISTLLTFLKRILQENILNSHVIHAKLCKYYNLNRFLYFKNIEESDTIYKSVKEVCETQLRKMLYVLSHEHISMDRFTSSERNDLEKIMRCDGL